jgi:hypothetical protein
VTPSLPLSTRDDEARASLTAAVEKPCRSSEELLRALLYWKYIAQ